METTEVALGRKLWTLEERIKKGEAFLKQLKAEYDQHEQQLLQVLADEGKTGTGHIEGVGEFKIRRENHPNVTQAAMPQFLDYLRDTDNAGIIIETVPAPTVKKFCRDELERLTELFVEDGEETQLAKRRLNVTEEIAPAKLAQLEMERHGVKTFSQIKLSHTKKGR